MELFSRLYQSKAPLFSRKGVFKKSPQKIEVDFFVIGVGVVPLNKTKDNRFYSQFTAPPQTS